MKMSPRLLIAMLCTHDQFARPAPGARRAAELAAGVPVQDADRPGQPVWVGWSIGSASSWQRLPSRFLSRLSRRQWRAPRVSGDKAA
jgi:hypothetical protein